jgi:hypothetical protein
VQEAGENCTCLTFCRHNPDHLIPRQHCQDHAKLAAGDNIATRVNGYLVLRMISSRFLESKKTRCDVYINLREHWRLETANGVEFATLGRVKEEQWQTLVELVIDEFAKALRIDGVLDRQPLFTTEHLEPQAGETVAQMRVSESDTTARERGGPRYILRSPVGKRKRSLVL